MKHPTYIFTVLLAMVLFASCSKSYLDTRPKSNIVIPTSIADLQGLLDDQTLDAVPAMGEISSDDYSIDYTNWNAMGLARERNLYVWAKEVYEGVGNVDDWNLIYKQVLYTNVILDQLSGIERNDSNKSDWDQIKGSALFIRAYAFFNLAQIFSLPYDSLTAATDMGIPLRLSPNINEVSVRASVKATYDKVLLDLKEAVALLTPAFQAVNRNRPSKSAAYALLARICLSMRDYRNAGLNADSSLQLYSTLIDYNTVSQSSTSPFTATNAETIYQNRLVTTTQVSLLRNTQGYSIDTVLFNSYNPNDLRKIIFFIPNGTYINRKNSYYGSTQAFGGLAVDEVLLTRAECYARSGQPNQAINDLNTLLSKRWRNGTFSPLGSTTASDALEKILVERRKELLMRGLRWIDIRRLNKEGRNIVPKRTLNGQTYQLSPNDQKYALPIPPDVISNSDLPQNPR